MQPATVSFSCKTKICPSCACRRMHSVSLDLVERVLPAVPYRHWVLSLPANLRFLLARDERLLSRFRKLFATSVRSFLRRKAKAAGIRSPLTGATLARLGLPLEPLRFLRARPPAQRFAFQRHSDFDGLDPPAPD